MGVLDFFRKKSAKVAPKEAASNKSNANKVLNSLKGPVPPPPPEASNKRSNKTKHSHLRNFLPNASSPGSNKTRRNELNANMEAALNKERNEAKKRGEQWTRQRKKEAENKLATLAAAKKAENNARAAAVEQSRKEAEEARIAKAAKKAENNARAAAVEQSRKEAEEARAAKAAEEKAAKELEEAAAKLKATAPAVAVDVPGLAEAAEAAVNGNAPAKPGAAPGDRFLCDADFTRKLTRQRAAVEEIHASRKKLGKGAYGYTTSAEVYFKPKVGALFDCIGALKVSIDTSDELNDDQLGEFSVYARTRSKPCLAQGLYVKLAGHQMKMVMEHYLIDLDKLYKNVLFSAYKRKPAVLEELAKAIAFQMLVALKGLHEENIIHRDLKPENVLLGHGGSVVVADFGLSLNNPFGFKKQQKEYWHASTATIEPPESVFNYGFEERFDIWSFGCCMIYYLLGTYPFDFYTRGNSWKKRVDASEFGDVRDEALADIKRKYSTQAAEFVKSCLRYNATQRPRAEEALRNPWFESMTLEKAQEIVNTHIGQYIRDTTAEKIRETRRRGNANTNVNTNSGSFVRIEPFGQSETAWKPWDVSDSSIQAKKWDTLGKGFVILLAHKVRIPIILHTIELFERYINTLDSIPDSLISIYFGCFYIASKLSDALRAKGISSKNIVGSFGKFKTWEELYTLEKKIVQRLHGDLFIQPGGFATEFAEICLKGRIERIDENSAIYFFFCFLLHATSDSIDGFSIEKLRTYASAYETVYKTGSMDGLSEDQKKLLELLKEKESNLSEFISILDDTIFKDSKKLFFSSYVEGGSGTLVLSVFESVMKPLRELYKSV
jgi:serine/threonine protein kinase